jgi:hypothetical protein
VIESGLDGDGAARALGLRQLREDPQFPHIPEDRRVELVDVALEDGHALANRACHLWGTDPQTIAACCSVPVIRSERDADFGSTVVYAEYATRPLSITLYLPAIRHLDRLIAERGVHLRLGMDRTAPLFLAHELYHHFDCTRSSGPLSRRYRVRLFGIGSWNWTSGLTSLAEIAAGAFAQRLLGLSFHPKMLDLLVLEG